MSALTWVIQESMSLKYESPSAGEGRALPDADGVRREVHQDRQGAGAPPATTLPTEAGRPSGTAPAPVLRATPL
jgi:hypothetical protein